MLQAGQVLDMGEPPHMHAYHGSNHKLSWVHLFYKRAVVGGKCVIMDVGVLLLVLTWPLAATALGGHLPHSCCSRRLSHLILWLICAIQGSQASCPASEPEACLWSCNHVPMGAAQATSIMHEPADCNADLAGSERGCVHLQRHRRSPLPPTHHLWPPNRSVSTRG